MFYLKKTKKILRMREIHFQNNLEEKLKLFFKTLIDEFATNDQSNYKLNFSLSRIDIAEAVNSRPESISRILTDWEEKSFVVSSNKNQFLINKNFIEK